MTTSSWVVAALLLVTLIPLLSRYDEPTRGRVAQNEANMTVSPSAQEILAAESDRSEAMAVQAQQLLATIEVLPKRIEDLGPYYWYTSALPGVSTITNSVNITVDLLRRQFNGSPQRLPLDPRSEFRGMLTAGIRLA